MSGWPRGPRNELHAAAENGSTERTAALLSDGSIDIDQGDSTGMTPLMWCCAKGYVRVARILVREGANMSIADDIGSTALHISAVCGHLAVTKLLARAGAELEAPNKRGCTALHMCTCTGHTGTMRALLEAGANPNSRALDQETPLACAASEGNLDAVKLLLRANADPMLAAVEVEGLGEIPPQVPLDMAAITGHAEVVRELMQQVGIEGCGGDTGGVQALRLAAANGSAGCIDVMTILADAGVVDTGDALFAAAGCGNEEAVKFLLQQYQQPKKTWEDNGGVSYVNIPLPQLGTPLLSAIFFPGRAGRRCHPRIARVLVDAGADTTSAVQVTNNEDGGGMASETPLDLANNVLRVEKGEKEADEKLLHRLEAMRRLLMTVEAIHAVSWLWPSDDVPSTADNAAVDATPTNKTSTTGTPLTLALPILRRRARERGVVLAPLFRYSAKPWKNPQAGCGVVACADGGSVEIGQTDIPEG